MNKKRAMLEISSTMGSGSREKFLALIDGPNFISRLLENGVSKETIIQELNLYRLCGQTQAIVREIIGTPLTLGIEFFCSARHFGPTGVKFSHEEVDALLTSLRRQTTVSVHQIDIISKSSEKEKGLDVSIVTRMFDMEPVYETLVLFASDKDYAPALHSLHGRGKFILTGGFEDTHPQELLNASYHFIDLKKLLPLILDKR